MANMDIAISAVWMGDSTMKINITVESGEVLDYDGYIRVYVTEIVSSLGWKDTGGEAYTFPFLDFAINEEIHVEGMQSWNKIVLWNGSEFGSLSPDNIMVIGVIFNGEKHQGYAVPPDGSPFDAYYVDDAAVAIPIIDTKPPSVEIISPKEGYLYLLGKEIIPVGKTMILGKIDIIADAMDMDTGIAKVEFYVDGDIKSTISSPPYQWMWDEFVMGNHEIRIVAKDFAGNKGSEVRNLLIFNL